MKFMQTLQKNLKLLFRSKETAFTIIFGPLLIILLVGFAFSGGDSLELSLGVYSPEYSELSDSIIQSLQDDFTVNILSSREECINNVQVGIQQLCIYFPEDFEVREQHTNTVTFHVDPSRINLVYQVIEQLGSELDVQRQELSLGLTGTILNNLNTTKTILLEQSENADEMQLIRSRATDALEQTVGKTQAESINFSFMDLRLLRGQSTGIASDAQQIFDISLERLEDARLILRDIEQGCDECSNSTKEKIDEANKRFEEAEDELRAIYEETPDKLQEISRMIDSASSRIQSIESEYDTFQQDASFVTEQIVIALSELEEMRDRINQLRGNVKYAYDLLDGVAIADSESIVNPIRTEIEEVTSESGNLVFTYPYILMLVIMFMGLMLASTLIVTDKNSKAKFRNFTTSTRDEFHVAMSFITTLLILLAQVFVILFFSYFLVSAPLLNNFLTSLFVIVLAITLFSFLGMILGYLANSQEAAMIGSLTIGSIMLFISNLVIPTEGMKLFVRALASVNPYVVLSELLKKSMLFDVGIGQFGWQLILIFVFAILLLVSVVAVQQYVRKKYFQQQATIEVKKPVRKRQPLELGERVIKDEYDLLTVLDMMTRDEFRKHVNAKQNPIHKWALDNKKLAKVLNTTSKEKMIIKLDKYLKRQTKNLKK